MRRPSRTGIALAAVVTLASTGVVRADERADRGIAGTAMPTTVAAAGTGSSAGRESAPPLATDDDELPEGHPAIEQENPHAHPGKGSGIPGVFEPPEDVEQPGAGLPPGTIAVDLHDADDKPVAGEVITLGMLINSIAKGDSRKHVQATTDAEGRAVFSNLETASNIAYRVSSGYTGGSFAASPFQLQTAKSMHVVLHVYQTTRDLASALIVCEATVAAELRDDRFQIEEALTIYNLGRTAWQPDDVRMALPEGFTAFNGQASMSDQGVDESDGAAKLRGTFPPGRHGVQFRWQIPWSGDKDVDFDVGLPPHVAIARVMMPAMSTIKLSAEGFPPPEVRHDEQGQTFLFTERRLMTKDAGMASLAIGIHDLPTPGPGKWIATLLAAAAVATGLVFAFAAKPRTEGETTGDAAKQRESLLAELADLERAHTSGDVGPRTYQKARRELIDALAHTILIAS